MWLQKKGQRDTVWLVVKMKEGSMSQDGKRKEMYSLLEPPEEEYTLPISCF